MSLADRGRDGTGLVQRRVDRAPESGAKGGHHHDDAPVGAKVLDAPDDADDDGRHGEDGAVTGADERRHGPETLGRVALHEPRREHGLSGGADQREEDEEDHARQAKGASSSSSSSSLFLGRWGRLRLHRGREALRVRRRRSQQIRERPGQDTRQRGAYGNDRDVRGGRCR